MQTQPIRIGFIGAGGISGAHRAALVEHPEEISLAGVADPNRALAEKLAADFRAPVFGNGEELLDGLKGKLDAVLISTPHFLHYRAAALAMEAGLPALVEKPVTCTLAELRRLSELEVKSGAFIQVGQQQRFGNEEGWLRGWLQSSAFGAPRLFNLDIYQNIEGYISDKPDAWILDKRKAGGGIVISVAVHILDLLRYWFDDDFTEVFAQGHSDHPFKNGAEATVAATLKMGRGTIGTLNCSYLAKRCPYSQRSLLFGSSGTLYQHCESPGGAYAGSYHIASDGGLPTTSWGMMYGGWESVASRMARESGVTSPEPHTAAYVTQMRQFARAVRYGRPGENSLARNFNTLALVEALGRSLESGCPVKVETKI